MKKVILTLANDEVMVYQNVIRIKISEDLKEVEIRYFDDLLDVVVITYPFNTIKSFDSV